MRGWRAEFAEIAGVGGQPAAKYCCHMRLTITRAVKGLSARNQLARAVRRPVDASGQWRRDDRVTGIQQRKGPAPPRCPAWECGDSATGPASLTTNFTAGNGFSRLASNCLSCACNFSHSLVASLRRSGSWIAPDQTAATPSRQSAFRAKCDPQGVYGYHLDLINELLESLACGVLEQHRMLNGVQLPSQCFGVASPFLVCAKTSPLRHGATGMDARQ